MREFIWARGRRLKLFGIYRTWKDALNTAKRYQRKLRNHYFIIPYESFFTSNIRYALYMDKVYRFGAK